MSYHPEQNRYPSMHYRSARSDLKLPAVSLGLWDNFCVIDPFENARTMARRAFDLGVTHIDLAKNYEYPYG